MVRLLLFVGVLGLILLAIRWGLRWLVKNRVRITIHRLPTDKEVVFLTVAMQVVRTLIRLFLRR